MTSRFVRPAHPTPIRLQARDRAVLHSVFLHRYLTSDHLRSLAFPGRSKRVAQNRLRLLWENSYLDRYFAPIVLVGEGGGLHQPSRPLYALARHGAEIIREDLDLPLSKIPHTPAANAKGWRTIEHNLVVTDLMVCVQAAVRPRDVQVRIERETALRSKLAAWADTSGPAAIRHVMPDGALTIALSCRPNQALTYYVEAIRADPPGGTRSVARKLERYIEFHRKGFFQRVFAHARVRAVLFTTTSEARTERLRALAKKLDHCRRLFWFASYDADVRSGAIETSFTPSRILEPIWRDANGDLHSLIPTEAMAPQDQHVCPPQGTTDAERDHAPR